MSTEDVRPNLTLRLKDGQEVGLDTLEIARAMYPDAEWIGYQDGERFEEPRSLMVVEADPSKMNREDLNTYAAEQGLADPASFRTKADLLAALDAPSDPPDDPPASPPVDVTVPEEEDETDESATDAEDEAV